MIEDKIQELKALNRSNDEAHSADLVSKRDLLISEIEEELVRLKDFYNWKQWINEKYKRSSSNEKAQADN
jgi:hypothetical protein